MPAGDSIALGRPLRSVLALAAALMRTNRPFWLTVASGLALVAMGYVGGITLMPDKTAGGPQIVAFLLSELLLLAGAVGLLGALVYSLAKAARERHRRKAAGL
jgi:hypothetical protein